ncbi:hypothetical protein PALB_20360 [Pseudoalteromonas luteoviolacea B = ATCC 29581]|nr:hypothetical protein PALB_20360 [Pseudoalteromonas luteoviolacea B = ATCC 29581]
MRFVLVVCLCILVGCQRPTVHLFMETLSQERQDLVEQSLQKYQIPYQISEASTPSEYQGAVLNKFAGNEDHGLYTQIRLAIIDAGFATLQINDLNHERHTFSNGHLGLYLVDQDAERIPTLLYGEDCDFDGMQVALNSNELWQTDKGRWHGDWFYFKPYLTLRVFENGVLVEEQPYKLSMLTEVTPFGNKPKWHFRALGYRKSNADSILDCNLSAVIMD